MVNKKRNLLDWSIVLPFIALMLCAALALALMSFLCGCRQADHAHPTNGEFVYTADSLDLGFYGSRAKADIEQAGQEYLL